MKIIPPYVRIYQQILKDLENAFPFLNVPKPKAGRKPKLTDIHIAAKEEGRKGVQSHGKGKKEGDLPSVKGMLVKVKAY